MGNFLPNPEETITYEAAKFRRCQRQLQYGLGSMQGWRRNMEDEHVILTSLPANAELNLPELTSISFFAVFDGHGGEYTSKYVAENILSTIQNNPRYKQLHETEDASETSEILEAIMSEIFPEIDKNLRALADQFTNESAGEDGAVEGSPIHHATQNVPGSTAIAAFLTETDIIVANLGDSRCIITKKDAVEFATKDHKPFDPEEEDRIIKSGSFVANKRVEGDLALSRAVGDFQYKNKENVEPFDQAVSIKPDISRIKIDPEYDFLILACDGIWDVLPSEAVAKSVYERITEGKTMQEVTEEMIKSCIDSYDNITLLIISLKELDYVHPVTREANLPASTSPEAEAPTEHDPEIQTSSEPPPSADLEQ